MKQCSKKQFVLPKLIAKQTKLSATSVCGWFTQCGSQVKCDK